MITALITLLGGLLYRLRGMDITGSTTVNRIVFVALPLPALLWLAGLPWQYALPTAPLAFLAMTTGWGAHQRMHADVYYQMNDKDKRELTTFWLRYVFGEWDASWSVWKKHAHQVSGMSFIGLTKTAVTALPMIAYSPLAGLAWALSGLLWGPVYWLGWQTNRVWGINWHETWEKWQGKPVRGHLRSGGEWGEVFVGFVYFGAASLVIGLI